MAKKGVERTNVKSTAPRPHFVTVLTALMSSAIALLALVFSIISFVESRGIQQLQQRAYLTVLGGVLDESSDLIPGEFDVAVTLFNGGNSPAYVTKATVDVGPNDNTVLYTQNIYDGKVNPISVDGRSQITKELTIAVPANIMSMLAGELPAFTFHVMYSDAYGSKSQVDWRWVLRPKRGPRKRALTLH